MDSITRIKEFIKQNFSTQEKCRILNLTIISISEQQWPYQIVTDNISDTAHIDQRIVDFVFNKRKKETKKTKKKKNVVDNKPLLFYESEIS